MKALSPLMRVGQQVAQVLEIIRTQRRRGLAMLFITHSLRVAAQACDRAAVMQAGRVVETGRRQDDLSRPAHADTQALPAGVPGRS